MLLKYFIFVFSIYFLIYFKYIYININTKKINIEINNIFNYSLYEKNLNFSNYSSDIKPIVFFYPEYIFNNNSNFNININNYFRDKENISKFDKNDLFEIVKEKVDLAMSHGIYGFCVYYCLDFIYETNKILQILQNKLINFPFFLIWKNDNLKLINIKNNISKIEELYLKALDIFINNTKKYIIGENYIKINNKPIISINQPLIIPKLNNFIIFLREKAKTYEIGDIFIFFPLRNITKSSKFISIFDGAYDLYNLYPIEENKNKQINLFFSGILHRNMILNTFKMNINIPIYRTSILEITNYSKKNKLNDYSPYKFYLLNKILIKSVKHNFNKNNRFIFIFSWNNYKNRNYLEPDEKYGYASLNYLSKALFNLSNNYNFSKIILKKGCYVAIQAHIYYEDLIFEIINKTNNMPIKFDLYITTISYDKKCIIEKYVKNYSLSAKYEIKIVENRGRDVLPLIKQLKYKIKKYKYFCHIHTKKSKHLQNFGNKWRDYLYNNLLGSREIINEILNDFETFDNLGFIFPELYYGLIKDNDYFYDTDFIIHKQNIKYMNYILNKINPKYKIGFKINFPAGNMFWAKVKAVYQIFEIRFIKKFPTELNQTNDTIMHAIERIWLYLVKLNGYDYKMIFKYY